MSGLEWSRLLQQQDSIVRSQDIRQKQRHNYHKLLYKNDLQSMMDEQKNQQARQKQEEKEFYQHLYKSLDHTGDDAELRRHSKLVRDSSEYNHNVGQQRKVKAREERNQQKVKLQLKFKTLEDEIQHQRWQEMVERTRKKQQLAQVYDTEIERQSSQRQLQRLQNERFERLAYQLQLRRQKQRIQSINKIKYGFGQSKQTYGKVSDLYESNQKEKNIFLQKMARSQLNPQQLQHKRKQQQHLHQTIQTSKFNKQAFIDRQRKKRQLQLKQLEEEHHKIVRIQQQLTQEAEEEKRKKEKTKIELKTKLETQIEDELQRKWRGKRMSQQEGRMNQGVHTPMLPGITIDHRQRRRQEILDSFMRGQRSMQVNVRP